MVQTKAVLRKELLAQRSKLDPVWIDQNNSVLNQVVYSFLESEVVLPRQKNTPLIVIGYAGFRNEPDILPSLARLGREYPKEVVLYLPRVVGKREMRFLRWLGDAGSLQKNSWGIPEPRFAEENRAEDTELDLQRLEDERHVLFVPCLGVSLDGSRLGYGAGFYDSCFAGICPRGVGICWHSEVGAQFRAEEHDLRLSAVCSQSGLKWLGSTNSPK
jgi:5-formyltetrahydrofolate cyclo-ligase